ncbi:MAG: hypothetical protein H6719_11295 [Sandaracinaceae bacterium]|nr:hypothetical protein [Sandaracinaceae bacterium]
MRGGALWLGLVASTALPGCFALFPYDDPTQVEICDNEMDDDADGRVDCRDPDCAFRCGERDADTCSDGMDNDGNGLVDCRDPSCQMAGLCREQSAELCSNGASDDGDDLVDCDDPDCDPFCPEVIARRCEDGCDNDGDGLADGADAACWPFFPITARACRSTAAQRFTSDLQSAEQYLARYYVDGPSVAIVNRPGPDATSIGGDSTLGSIQTFSGRAEDLFLTALVDLSATDATFRVELARGSTTPVGTPYAAALPVVEATFADRTLTLRVGATETRAPAVVEPGLHRLTIQASSRVRPGAGPGLAATLEPVGGTSLSIVAAETTAIMDDLPESRLLLSDGVFLSADVTIDGSDPCDVPVPGVIPPADVVHVALSPFADGWCATSTTRDGGVYAHRSTDGLTWTSTVLIEASPSDPFRASAVTELEGGGALMVFRQSGGRLVALSSPDCARFSASFGVPLAPRSSAEPGSLSLTRRALEDGEEEISLFWVEPIEGDRWLVQARSFDGGRTFEDVGAEGRRGPRAVLPLDASVGDSVSVGVVGDQLVMTYLISPFSGADGLGLRIAQNLDAGRELGGFDEVGIPGTFLRPTGRPGTFDRDALLGGAIAARGESILLLYLGLGDFVPTTTGRRATFGTAWLEATPVEDPPMCPVAP